MYYFPEFILKIRPFELADSGCHQVFVAAVENDKLAPTHACICPEKKRGQLAGGSASGLPIVSACHPHTTTVPSPAIKSRDPWLYT